VQHLTHLFNSIFSDYYKRCIWKSAQYFNAEWCQCNQFLSKFSKNVI